VTQVRSNDGVGMTVGERRRPSWLANGLLVLGAWLVLSPLLLAPSMWEFADGVDAYPLTPISPSKVTEPTRAMVARAEWNSILAGLLILARLGARGRRPAPEPSPAERRPGALAAGRSAGQARVRPGPQPNHTNSKNPRRSAVIP
jgi:hypothetical protein